MSQIDETIGLPIDFYEAVEWEMGETGCDKATAIKRCRRKYDELYEMLDVDSDIYQETFGSVEQLSTPENFWQALQAFWFTHLTTALVVYRVVSFSHRDYSEQLYPNQQSYLTYRRQTYQQRKLELLVLH